MLTVAKSGTAMQQVVDDLCERPPSSAKELDLIFLRGIMESPIVRSLAKAHDRLEDVKLEAVRDNNLQLVGDILSDVDHMTSNDDNAAELYRILTGPHFKSLLEAHDMVASKSYEVPRLDSVMSDWASEIAALPPGPSPSDTIRIISITKKAGEPLGVTFRMEHGECVVARVLHGSLIDRQGMLHVGDIIREFDGQPIGAGPVELQRILKEASGDITLKIFPSYRDNPTPAQLYLKPHFSYSPESDTLIPCKEAGLPFTHGEILHVVNRDDTHWWQACKVVGGATGLIPSQFLEEKRKAFVRTDTQHTGVLCGTVPGKKKKKKLMYLTARNAEFDRCELLLYEEVVSVPAFRRKTLVLLGAQGVGRRSLKNRLITQNPKLYGTTVPFTSRPPRSDECEGVTYSFVSRDWMEADIKAGLYLEHGQYGGSLYGTKISSIQNVLNTGRTCIIDVNPQALKVLRTSEFLPFVVFIAAPPLDVLRNMHNAALQAGVTHKQLTDADLRRTVDESVRIGSAYSHYFDLVITNEGLDHTYNALNSALNDLHTHNQWVPVSWVF
ncbi:MAGUK p55 subfamily member 6a [Engraulis encrasicolus]|uniref:MAGUK p55 subfamily member 6a n=1 Tax=Engraulis encrasicolus TaxID=184585 RepID=UPI002FD6CCA3